MSFLLRRTPTGGEKDFPLSWGRPTSCPLSVGVSHGTGELEAQVTGQLPDAPAPPGEKGLHAAWQWAQPGRKVQADAELCPRGPCPVTVWGQRAPPQAPPAASSAPRG